MHSKVLLTDVFDRFNTIEVYALHAKQLSDFKAKSLEHELKTIMSGVKNKDEEKELRVDSATGTNKKKKRKTKGTLSNWKDRASNKREYENKLSK